MARNPIRILEIPQAYKIYVQPGDKLESQPLDLTLLLARNETVASAVADDATVISQAAGEGRLVLIDVMGPANGVQKPVRLTINGSLGSRRTISLLVIGRDPFAAFTPETPNIFLRWRSGYSGAATYLPYDLVLYAGVIYLALVSSTDQQPDTHPAAWMAWAGTGGGGGGGPSVFTDAGGSGRMGTFRTTWEGPGPDDWKVEFVGVQ